MAFTPVSNTEAIEALYIGYFGRAGEPGGVDYWVGRMNQGMTFAEVAASFSEQPEAKGQHSFLANPDTTSPEAFVTSLYDQLLEREPDASGFAYWVSQLEAADGNPLAIGLLIAQFISGASEANGDAQRQSSCIFPNYCFNAPALFAMPICPPCIDDGLLRQQ